MDSSIIIPLLVNKRQLHCPKCGGTVTSFHGYKYHALANRSPRAADPVSSCSGFDVTLVCGSCGHETPVNEKTFEACIADNQSEGFVDLSGFIPKLRR